jgi:uncharacterized protein
MLNIKLLPLRPFLLMGLILVFYWSMGWSNEFSDTLAKATNGDPAAQFSISQMYYAGIVVSRNTSLGLEWVTKSAKQGYADAELDLAFIYDGGRGVPPDKNKADEWYTKAAKHGNTQAKEILKKRENKKNK